MSASTHHKETEDLQKKRDIFDIAAKALHGSALVAHGYNLGNIGHGLLSGEGLNSINRVKTKHYFLPILLTGAGVGATALSNKYDRELHGDKPHRWGVYAMPLGLGTSGIPTRKELADIKPHLNNEDYNSFLEAQNKWYALNPEAKHASYTKPELRERIKSRVMASGDGGKPGQWSARKAQIVAQKYESAGGGYSGAKTEGQKSLSKWTDQKWTTSDGKPAERKGGTTRYLPEKAWDKLSPGERAATNAKKREGSRKGEQFVANTEAAAEARKEAMAQKRAYESGAWQRSEGKNPEGGLNAKGRASLKAQGHDIKPGVKGKADTPEKMKRKGSFLSRMFGPGAPGSMKKDNGEPSRRALSAKAWGEPVPSDDAGRARLYAKGQALLKRYEGKKKEAAENAYLSVLAHYGLSEKVAALAKLALVAWKRPQNLTPENIGRLSNAVGLNAGNVDLKKIQKGLQAFSTDLDPAQLARHRVLQEKLTPELMRHFDVIPKNMIGGPRTQGMFGMADIHMDPQTGTMLREALSNNPLKRLVGSSVLHVGQSYGPKSYQKAFDKAIDPGLTNSILRHELAEKRLIQGASKGYKPTPFASHLGPLPLVAERTGVRDPEVHRIIDKLRTTAKDDIQATKLLRQSGQVGNYTLPEGGRAMRSLERQVERMPIVEGEAARLSLDSPLMAGPGFEKATKQPGFVQNLTERLSPDSRRKMEALRGATDVSRARYQEPMSQDAAHRYLAILSGNRDKSARPGIFGLTHMPEPPAF